MSFNDIKTALFVGSFTDEELTQLNHIVVSNLKAKRQEKNAVIVGSLRIGSRVEFGRPNGSKHTGIIEKLNIKTATVTGDDGRSWRVAASLIKAI